jgi:hypothetical protein
METKIHVAVCWIVVPCSDAVGCQRFRELCYLHLHPSSGLRWGQHDPPKRRYPTTEIPLANEEKLSTDNELVTNAAWSSETWLSYHIPRYNPEDGDLKTDPVVCLQSATTTNTLQEYNDSYLCACFILQTICNIGGLHNTLSENYHVGSYRTSTTSIFQIIHRIFQQRFVAQNMAT